MWRIVSGQEVLLQFSVALLNIEESVPCPLISIKGCPRSLKLAPIFMYSYNMQHDASYISNFFGTDGDTKFDEFSELFQRGGGHFHSKNLYCRFWTLIKPRYGGDMPRFQKPWFQNNKLKTTQSDMATIKSIGSTFAQISSPYVAQIGQRILH